MLLLLGNLREDDASYSNLKKKSYDDDADEEAEAEDEDVKK